GRLDRCPLSYRILSSDVSLEEHPPAVHAGQRASGQPVVMCGEGDGRRAFHQIARKTLGLEHRLADTPDRQRNIEQSLGRPIFQAILLIATQEKGETVRRYSPEVRM